MSKLLKYLAPSAAVLTAFVVGFGWGSYALDLRYRVTSTPTVEPSAIPLVITVVVVYPSAIPSSTPVAYSPTASPSPGPTATRVVFRATSEPTSEQPRFSTPTTVPPTAVPPTAQPTDLPPTPTKEPWCRNSDWYTVESGVVGTDPEPTPGDRQRLVYRTNNGISIWVLEQYDWICS